MANEIDGGLLDSYLVHAIDRSKPAGYTPQPLYDGAGNLMPEVGGKTLAHSLRTSLAGVRRVLDEAKLEVAGAVTEVTTEAKNMKEAAKRLRSEAADMRSASREILGNESAEVQADDVPAGVKGNGADTAHETPGGT